MYRRAGAVAVVVGAVGLVISATPACASTTTSPNWSGYVAQATNEFTAASGRWTEPMAACTGTNTAAAFWVGLDGYSDETVEQIGVQANCVAGQPEYFAWWQMWPSPVHDLSTTNYPVQPSDVLTASVARTGTSYKLTLRSSRGWHYTTTQTATDENTSAEWIASSPRRCHTCDYALLTDFGSVNFTHVEAADDGSLEPLSSWTQSGGPIALRMVSAAGTLRAKTGAVDGKGRSFAVTWVHG
jgi:hypothetical protein